MLLPEYLEMSTYEMNNHESHQLYFSIHVLLLIVL